MTTQKFKVLFVCMGNICRSPTAEGIFKHLLSQENLSREIHTDSAGTHAYHIGDAPDSRAQSTAKHHGVDISTLCARKVTPEDFYEFDYIIAMDNANLNILKEISSQLDDQEINASLQLFLEYTNNSEKDNLNNLEVPDPYYGGINGFEEVFQMLTHASHGLITEIKNRMM